MSGEVGYLNDRCPWAERRGLLVTVVSTDGCADQYPVAGLGRGEVIVYVHEDPLAAKRPQMLPNGQPWSCVAKRGFLTLLRDVPPETDLRTVLRHWTTEVSS